MEFSAFDTNKIDEYTQQAKQSWGGTKEYKEFERKNANRTASDNKALGEQLMAIIGEFGTMKDKSVFDSDVVVQVKKLQNFITEHYYNCSDEILAQLGEMYGAGGEFTTNINAVGGDSTAEYAAEAIKAYCEK